MNRPPSPPDDEDPKQFQALIRAAQAGDEGAWSSLVSRYWLLIYVAVHGEVRSGFRRRMDTEDIVQSAFASIFESLPEREFEARPCFEAWLRRIAVNKLKGRLRKHKAHRRDVRRDEDVDGSLITAGNGAEQETPSEIVSRDEMLGQILEALPEINDPSAEVIRQRFLVGRSTTEIAADLQVSEATVRRRLSSGIKEIQGYIARRSVGGRAS